MNRNKYFYKEKLLYKLKRRLDEIREEERNLGYVELETPHFLGYIAYLVPRQDIQNREDASIYWEISKVGSTQTAKTIKKFSWNDPKWRKTWRQEKPSLNHVSVEQYKKLSDKAKKFFNIYNDYNHRRVKEYYCTLPSWYFEIAYKKRYRTSIKIESTSLESESALLVKQIDLLDISWGLGNSGKYHRRFENRRQRRYNKIQITTCKYNFYDNYKDHAYWW